jgi:hypothetical protein
MINASINNREEIAIALKEAVDEVNNFVKGLDAKEYEHAPEGKWNASQQVDHLIRSMKPLNLAYALPGFVLKLKFGVANRPSKTYGQLVEKYKTRLAAGGRATGQFIPEQTAFVERDKLIDKYNEETEKLVKKIKNYNEANLDKYILPHPLLGKLTLREMLFFTIHHNEHHLDLIKKYSSAV